MSQQENNKSLASKLIQVQKELKAPKNQKNSFGNYNYRNAEDILEAVKPLLEKEGLLILVTDEIEFFGLQTEKWLSEKEVKGNAVKEEIVSEGRYYVKAIAKVTDGKDEIHTSAYAREPFVKKGMDTAQITGATSSYARKYALNGLFAIDDTKDADSMDNSAKTKGNGVVDRNDAPDLTNNDDII